MMIKKYTPEAPIAAQEKNNVVEFLYKHLDEFGDDKTAIAKAIDYSQNPNRGGFVLMMRDKEEILGALIMNQTGMHEYIPSNILVYVAVHSKTRGQGLGKQLVQEAIQSSEGGIALHVEPNNPAKFLYEKLGFTNKYLEMRLI
jgi:[ribosomal protein S18]-alanine N-acetyltransferase